MNEIEATLDLFRTNQWKWVKHYYIDDAQNIACIYGALAIASVGGNANTIFKQCMTYAEACSPEAQAEVATVIIELFPDRLEDILVDELTKDSGLWEKSPSIIMGWPEMIIPVFNDHYQTCWDDVEQVLEKAAIRLSEKV